jgi:hypothetical protein
MLTSYDKRSVRYLIEQSDLRERDFLEARAKMELDIINSQCLNRALTDREMSAFEFAIETITQLETRHHREHG